MSSMRVVHARGSAAARGAQIGQELSDLIRRSIDFYHRYLDRRGVSSTQLQDLLPPSPAPAEPRFREHRQILKGRSIGALVRLMELFAINAFEELEPLLE